MADSSGSRREGLLIRAFNPLDGGTCVVQLRQERILAVGRRSRGQAMECGYIVPHILQHPTAVFEGLRREEDEDPRGAGWRCYCGLPTHSYTRDGSEAPPYPRQVYLVFVDDEGVAYNWRWEQADPTDLRLPANHEDRFTRRLP
jgi:hypothetical protein